MESNLEKAEYLKDIYKFYLSHLNSVFNFFIVFAGLTLSGIALIVREGLNQGSYIDEAFVTIGIVFSLIFFGIDFRDRQIVRHLEKQMTKFEEKIFGADSKSYLIGVPDAALSFVRMSFLFPASFIIFALFLSSLFCFL